ncbi:MAG: phosphodiester glycosidase family protein [Armatimonadota bacterium]|nr:phosphodiester glycosidase family protein [Armatimonadota bacterium]MDR7544679.1 phosphodiester glycosidase family protein [Armatimonadota bacterium]
MLRRIGPPAIAARGCAALMLVAVGLVLPARAQATDIAGHWAEDEIRSLIARGIIAANADAAFRPDEPVSRVQFIAWLVAARGWPAIRLGAAPFPDVPPGGAAAAAVETAVAYGIVQPGGHFRPDAALLRGEAFVFLVRALGYTFETGYMSNAALPFGDVDGLPPPVRGAIAVAVLSAPPLLREPPSDRVRPQDPMTRAEAASLVAGYLRAIERGLSLTFTVPLGPGVTLILEKRGALRALPVWRVQVGSFQDEERAQRLADAMRARGFPVVIDQQDEVYKVRVGSFATRQEAAALQARLAGEGLATWAILTVHDYDALPGPFWTGALLIEPAGGARLRPSLARETVIGRGRTSEVARRAGAIAAINAGFFASTGDPLGCLVIDGEVISEPLPNRTCAGITDDGQVLFDVLRLDASVSGAHGTVTIDGVNRERGANEIILYRPAYGPSTRTNQFGAEVTVVGDVVQSVANGRANTAIPPDGYVLSGHGRGRAALLAALRPESRVALRVRLVPQGGDPRWEEARQIIGGGPRLLQGGQFVGGEGFRSGFADRRHPRTAIGRLADGRILLMVVGGRQPYHSLGMTLPELASLMRQLGVTDALNLDGGGSSTLVVRGAVINLPSDETGERPVSDVLLVLLPAAGSRLGGH